MHLPSPRVPPYTAEVAPSRSGASARMTLSVATRSPAPPVDLPTEAGACALCGERRGVRLAAAKDLPPQALTARERAFLDASESAAQQTQERGRRSLRRLRRLAGALVVLLVCLVFTIHVPIGLLQPRWYLTGRIASLREQPLLLPCLSVLWLLTALKI